MISKEHAFMGIMNKELNNHEITKKHCLPVSVPFIPDCQVIPHRLSEKKIVISLSAQRGTFEFGPGSSVCVSMCLCVRGKVGISFHFPRGTKKI